MSLLSAGNVNVNANIQCSKVINGNNNNVLLFTESLNSAKIDCTTNKNNHQTSKIPNDNNVENASHSKLRENADFTLLKNEVISHVYDDHHTITLNGTNGDCKQCQFIE